MEKTRNSLGRIPAFMLYFFLGQAGFVRREPASTAAWIVGVLIAGAVLLGAPQKAEALTECGGMSWPWCDTNPGHCQTWCSSNYPLCTIWFCDTPEDRCSCWFLD